MIFASVVSPVIGTGITAPGDNSNAYRPRLFDIPGVVSFTDATGANPPTTPNYCVFECVFTPEAFAAVQADTENYLVISWSENG